MGLEAELTAALAEVTTTPADKATVELARTYARALDVDGEVLTKIGPALLACLESLLMTPRSRAALLPKGGAPSVDNGKRSPADELRARRAARVAGAAAVDPAAP